MKLNDVVPIRSPYGLSYGKIIEETKTCWMVQIGLFHSELQKNVVLTFDKNTLEHTNKYTGLRIEEVN